jgi:hypothetical protein
MISQRSQRSGSTSPPGTPPVRRWSGPFLSRAAGRQPPVVLEGCHSWQLARVQGGAPKETIGGPKRRPQRVIVTTSCDEGDNNKEADDFDEELIATVERDLKCQSQQPADHFEKLLEAICPNYAYPVRHKLKECTMMNNYMTMEAFTKGKKPKDGSVGKAVACCTFPRRKCGHVDLRWVCSP